jgi:hypothetical protein
MFDETSHFISATPLTKTFSTFSSVVVSSYVLFFAMSNKRQQRAQQRRTQNRSRQISVEMDKKEKTKRKIYFLLFASLYAEICLNVFKVTWRRKKENTMFGAVCMEPESKR